MRHTQPQSQSLHFRASQEAEGSSHASPGTPPYSALLCTSQPHAAERNQVFPCTQRLSVPGGLCISQQAVKGSIGIVNLLPSNPHLATAWWKRSPGSGSPPTHHLPSLTLSITHKESPPCPTDSSPVFSCPRQLCSLNTDFQRHQCILSSEKY